MSNRFLLKILSILRRIRGRLRRFGRKSRRIKQKLVKNFAINRIQKPIDKSYLNTLKPIDESYLNTLKPIGVLSLLLFDLSKKGVGGKYILDVGAHSTEWSRLAMKVFPNAQIYLIEPLQEMEVHLMRFCVDFPSSKYFLNGAGAKEETHLFSLSGALDGANFLQDESDYLKSINLQREVKLVTIDSLIERKEIEIPEIVKLDVQGYELEALKGATKLFGKTEVFILEVSFFEFVKGTPIFSEVIIFMAERGYEVYDFPGFLRRPYDGALGQIDVCFVKRKGILRSSDAW